MILLLLSVGLSFGNVRIDPQPNLGEPTVIEVRTPDGDPAVGLTVRISHREGLHNAREVAAGITDHRGRVRWTPSHAGRATLRAGPHAAVVHVGGGPAPWGAITLLGAQLLLGLGLWVRTRRWSA